MSKQINVEEILKKYEWKSLRFGKTAMKEAIKEIVEAVIDECDNIVHCSQNTIEDDMKLSESILNVKKQVIYEKT